MSDFKVGMFGKCVKCGSRALSPIPEKERKNISIIKNSGVGPR